MPRLPRHDRAHDYKHLIRRWRSVARNSGLRMVKFAGPGGYDHFYLERSPKGRDGWPSRPTFGTAGGEKGPLPLQPAVPTIYLSAGIHGDEPGATEGLLAWAEKNIATLRKMNFLIFPCLNPWGLVNNSRYDQHGQDLNRSYHDDSLPFIAAHKRVLGRRRFDLALLLHEDYDAMGAYIYEVRDAAPGWGAQLLQAACPFVSIDGRKKIEGRSVRQGLLWRKVTPDLMPTWPEAFQLYFHHVKRVFTIETPSEFHIDQRVAAQVAMLTRALGLCRAEHATLRKSALQKNLGRKATLP